MNHTVQIQLCEISWTAADGRRTFLRDHKGRYNRIWIKSSHPSNSDRVECFKRSFATLVYRSYDLNSWSSKTQMAGRCSFMSLYDVKASPGSFAASVTQSCAHPNKLSAIAQSLAPATLDTTTLLCFRSSWLSLHKSSRAILFFSGKGSSHKFLEPSDALASALRIYKHLFHQVFLPHCRDLGEEDHLSQSGLVQRAIKSPRLASYMSLLLSASNLTFLSSVSLHLARGAYRTEMRNSDWPGNA